MKKSNPSDYTRKIDYRFNRQVGRDHKPQISDYQIELTGFLGLWSRPTLRSNRAWDLAVTREARLGDRKLIFRLLKIYALKPASLKQNIFESTLAM